MSHISETDNQTTEVITVPTITVSFHKTLKGCKSKPSNPDTSASLWEPVTVSLYDFGKRISNGDTWMSAILKPDAQKNSKSSVERCEVVGLDFDVPDALPDDGGPLADHFLITYATFSASDEHPYKSRAVIRLKEPLTGEQVALLMDYVVKKLYPLADRKCTNPNRAWFGTDKTCKVNAAAVPLDGKEWLEIIKAEQEASKPVKSQGVKKSGTDKGNVVKRAPGRPQKERKSDLDLWYGMEWVYSGCADEELGIDPWDGERSVEFTEAQKEALLTLVNWVMPDACHSRKGGHEWKIRPPRQIGEICRFEGYNPFSPTDSSGTSLLVTLSMPEGEPQMLWYDSSGNAPSMFREGAAGGSPQSYWYLKHPLFVSPKKDACPLPHTTRAFVYAYCLHHGRTMPYNLPVYRASSIPAIKLKFLQDKRLRWDDYSQRPMYGDKPFPMAHLNAYAAFATSEEPTKYVREAFVSACMERRYNALLERAEAIANEVPQTSETLSFWNGCAIIFGHIWNPQPPAMPTCTREEFELYSEQLKRMALAMFVRQYFDEPITFEAIALPIGREGTGKTGTIRTLYGKEIWGELSLLAEFRAGNDDDRRDQLILKTKAAVDMSELGQSKKEITFFRALISQSSVELRRLGTHDLEEAPVRAVLWGNSNYMSAIRDPHTLRRYWPIPVHSALTKVYGDSSKDVPRHIVIQFFKTFFAEGYREFRQNIGRSAAEWEAALMLPPHLRELAMKKAEMYSEGSLMRSIVHEKLCENFPDKGYGTDEERSFIFPVADAQRMFTDNPASPQQLGQINEELKQLGFYQTKAKYNKNTRDVSPDSRLINVWKYRPKAERDAEYVRLTPAELVANSPLSVPCVPPPAKPAAPAQPPAPEPYDWEANTLKPGQMAEALNGKVPPPEHRYEVGTAISDKLPDARPTEAPTPPATPAQPLAAPSAPTPQAPPAQPDEEDEDSPATITDEDDEAYRDEMMARSHRPAPAPMDASEAFQRMMELARLANSKD